MGRNIKPLIRDPLFLIGVTARLILIGLFAPAIHADWFVPFFDNFFNNPDIDPWRSHLNAGGNSLAFPYGPIMWILLLPGAALGQLGGAVFTESSTQLLSIGFSTGILVLDFLLLRALLQILPSSRRMVVLLYWLSPIVLYLNYWHGQVDVVPVLVMTTSLVAIRKHKFTLAGVILGAAFAAKLSMILALPFILVYLIRNNRFRRYAPKFMIAVGITTGIFQGPYLLSPAVRSMVLDTPEAEKIYDLSLNLGSFDVLLLPLSYMLVVLAFWQLRRMSFGLLIASLGLGFFLVLLLSPASPGWFLWVVPMLVMYQIQSGRTAISTTAVFSVLLTFFNLLQSEGAFIRLFRADFSAPLIDSISPVGDEQLSLLLTVVAAIGGLIAYRMARDGINDSDFFGLRSRPFILGISGDSGSGKDTLSIALERMFGSNSVANISGDDFHMWDRDQPLWQTTTHLNPRANDLTAMTKSVTELSESRSISVNRYDHSIGRFTESSSLAHNDFVLVSGLLVLYLPQLRERCDASIFLNMDEGLRRRFKFQRDVVERGHSTESVKKVLDDREEDTQRFIKPQIDHADIVFRIEPAHPAQLNDGTDIEDIRLQLRISLRDSLYHEELIRLLISVCGVNPEHDLKESNTSIEILIGSEVSSEDLQLIARRLVPQSDELLDVNPEWQSGVTGLMQLIVLAQTAQILRERSR